MSQQAYFPPLDLPTIRMLTVIRQQTNLHGISAYLENSPYPLEVRNILEQCLREPARVRVGGEEDSTGVDTTAEMTEEQINDALKMLDGDGLERELAILYSRMKAFGATLEGKAVNADGDTVGPKAKASDKTSYYRTMVSLMSKIGDLRKEAADVNQWLSFKNRVMALLNDVMTADQRNAFLTTLEADFGYTPKAENTPENTPE